MTRWITWQSHADASKSKAQNNGPEQPWWRLRVHPLTDEEYLERMIAQGRAEKLELVKHYVGSARTRQSEKFRISAPLLSGGKTEQVRQLVRSWVKEESATPVEPSQRTTDGDAARQLAAVVGPEIVELGFDDGWVVVKDEFERTKQVSPSRLSEIFTYEQARDHRLDTPGFYAQVRKTALRLQRAHNLSVSWPPH